MIGPNTGIAIGLQFDPHLNAIGADLAANRLLRIMRLGQSAEQVLDVMADFMRNHISLCEFTGIARATMEARFDLAKKRSVEIYAPVARTIERPARRLRIAAAALLGIGEQPQTRRRILPVHLFENIAPGVFGIAQHRRNELAGRVGRRAAAPVGLLVGLLILRAAAADHFGAADQNAGIDAERPSDQPQHHDRTNT